MNEIAPDKVQTLVAERERFRLEIALVDQKTKQRWGATIIVEDAIGLSGIMPKLTSDTEELIRFALKNHP